jgi:Ca2+-binding RTX toxin-like protein
MTVAVSASSYLSGRVETLLSSRPDATQATHLSGSSSLAVSPPTGLTNADYVDLLVRDTVSSSFELVGLAQVRRAALDEVANYLSDIVSREQRAASLVSGSEEWQTLQDELTLLEENLSVFLASQSLGVKDLQGRFSALQDLNKQYFQAQPAGIANDLWSPNTQGMVEVELNRLFSAMTLRPAGGCTTCGQVHFMGACGAGTVDLNAAPAQNNTNVTGATSSSASGVSYIETLRMGPIWDLSAGETLSYSYYDSTSSPAFVGYPAGGVDPASAAYSIVAFENDLDAAFDLWDLVSDGLTMEKVTETGAGTVGELRVAYTDSTQTPAGAAAYAFGPGTSTVSGDIWFDKDQTSNQSFSPGGYGFMTALHEIGHAIGLSHPFDGGSATGATLPASTDNIRNTLMSYTNTDRNLVLSVSSTGGGVSYSMSQGIYSKTPMLYDVAAIEYLYGASTTTNTGDTVYTWSDAPQVLETIIDSDGIDTIDASSQTRASVIDLTPGAFSSIGLWTLEEQLDHYQTLYGGSTSSTLRSYVSSVNASYGVTDALYTGQDNVGIAFSATIENAIGGAGNDYLQGNNVDNRLKGNAGNDTIIGGLGQDTAVFNGVKSNYSITYAEGTTWIVKDLVGTDGEDLISEVEFFEFSDITWAVTTPSLPAPGFSEKSGYIFAHGYMTQRTTAAVIQSVAPVTENTITGSSRSERLNGTDANDMIIAGAGDDVVRAGRGDDLIVAGSGQGNDIYFGGEGVDAISYASAKAGVVIDLEAGYAKSLSGRDDAKVGVDAIAEIENVIGSAYGDLIYGDAGNNVIDGNGGSDTIFGGAGEDTAVFSGSRHDYSIRKVTDGYSVTNRDGVTTTLYDVELVQFSSGLYRLIDPNSLRDATTFKNNWASGQVVDTDLAFAAANRIGESFDSAYQRSMGLVGQSRKAFDQAISYLESQVHGLIKAASSRERSQVDVVDLPVDYLLDSAATANRLIIQDAAQAVLTQANQSQRFVSSLLQS